MADAPETRYTKSGDLHIAYQVTGGGPLDLVFVPGFVSHLEAQWEEPEGARQYYRMVRRELARFRGRELDTAGDGVFAAFDGPARGIRCASAVREAVRPLTLDVRAGLHTGECEVVGQKLAGIAVHIGARVAASAAAGEVLVSNTVKDLVAGSGIGFENRGTHVLKGVPGKWPLYVVTNAA